MPRWNRIQLFAGSCLAVAGVLLAPGTAAGHPMGTLSINRWTAITFHGDRLEIVHRVDYAEVPTAAELAAAGVKGTPSAAQRDALRRGLAARVTPGLRVTAGGAPVALVLDHADAEVVAGEGGLPALRLDLWLTARLPGAPGDEVEVGFADTNFAGRAGWKEIVAEPAGDAAILAADVPRVDRSRGLSAFPADATTAPASATTAALRVRLGAPRPRGAAAAAAPSGRAPAPPDRLARVLGQKQLTPPLVALALVIALGLGALHALSPGHGKALVAAWLVGTRGTVRHAVLLGAVVTVTHTAGVFALGAGTLALSSWIMPDRLLPWLQLVSGVMIVVVGATIVTRRLREVRGHRGDLAGSVARASFRPARPAPPGGLARLPAAGAHAHDHAHDAGHHHHGLFGHTHSHAPGPPGTGSLVALGVSAGLVPCPSALVVLLSAVALNRVALGLVLILCFSLGLAIVLSLIGVLVVRGARLLSRARGFDTWARRVPIVSGALVAVLGVALSIQALVAAGVLRLGR